MATINDAARSLEKEEELMGIKSKFVRYHLPEYKDGVRKEAVKKFIADKLEISSIFGSSVLIPPRPILELHNTHRNCYFSLVSRHHHVFIIICPQRRPNKFGGE